MSRTRSAPFEWSIRNMLVPGLKVFNSFVRCCFPFVVGVYDIPIIDPILYLSKKDYSDGILFSKELPSKIINFLMITFNSLCSFYIMHERYS